MRLPRPALFAIAALTLLGLALRILAARGGLWLDEAWSAIFARDAGDALHVLLAVRHDNNHILNTLWLQLVGWNAPPLAQRALSVASGTAAIPLAAFLLARRGTAPAIIAATGFALSPLLVTYGSEARGYAPMLLGLLAAIAIVDRWLIRPATPPPAAPLALAIGLGALAHLTIAFGYVAIAGWVMWHRKREALRLMAPAGIALIGVATLLLGGGDLAVGAYQPFALAHWYDGIGELVRFLLGAPERSKAALPPLAAALVAAWAIFVRDRLAAHHLLAILAFPIAVALIQLGNSGAPRYFLVAGMAMLLLLADAIGRLWARGGVMRVAACVALMAFAVGSLATDLALIENRRGDPAKAIDAIVQRSPNGARIMIDHPRDAAVVEIAAAQAGARLAIDTGRCADYLFLSRDGSDPLPRAPVRCGARYRPIVTGHTTGLSGNHWRLYLRDG
ncbi:hypothetical protein [Sphingomonas baiyangensis]|uniref:Glycosyltransferase RgtA/B/C/D-like domain-containing protein n=1 Tax=Sphingomonas baiyangensis TaxID=2572576 RepID=A0A4U1L3W0_9SPHN|nr:hypothetical protein [Sphingomonas baiyangensis]TKD50825.1 hypothetical protein FBR43_08645 [Sphingomonas baiyangensis]